MTHATHSHRGTKRASRGFSLIELMVAVAIALFLIGGMATILQHNRATSIMQTNLAQMQDNERLALTQIATVVEAAGYFPNPFLNTASSAIQTGSNSTFAANGFGSGSPAVFGVAGPAPPGPGDSLTVRYAAGDPDGIFNCLGAQNTTVAPAETWENTFSVNAQNQLVCQVWTWSTNTATAPVPLTPLQSVQSMTVLYGVQTSAPPPPAGPATCTDTYKTAGQMAAGDWANVCSVVVTLAFFNQLDPTQAPVQLTRVIPVMQMVGPT